MGREIAVIQMTDSEITVLWAKLKQKDKTDPWEVEVIPVPPGVICQGELLKREMLENILHKSKSCQRLKAGKTSAIFVLNQLQGFCRTFSLPWISPQKRAAAMQFLLNDEYAADEQALWFDYLTLEENKEENILQVMAGAARSHLLAPYAEALEAVGFRVENVYFGAALLTDFLALKTEEDALFLDLDGKIPQMIFWHGRYPGAMRVWTPTTETIFDPEEWAGEVRRLLLYAGGQWEGLNLQTVYTGGERSRAVADQVGLSQRVLAVRQILEQRRPEAAALFSGEYALGGAFLEILLEDRKKKIRLDLVAKSLKQKKWLRRTKIAAAIWLIACVAGFGGQGITMRERGQWSAESEAAKAQVTSALDHQTQDQSLESQWRKALEPSFQIASHLDQLERIRTGTLTYDEIQYKDGILGIKGTASSARDVRYFLEGMESLGWRQPVLTGYKQALDGVFEFAIQAQAATP